MVFFLGTPTNNFIRRTGSLDDLRNGWIFGPVFYFNQSTQTDENFSERTKGWLVFNLNKR